MGGLTFQSRWRIMGIGLVIPTRQVLYLSFANSITFIAPAGGQSKAS